MKEKEISLGETKNLKELKMSIVTVRNSVEMGVLQNEELYPLDTFRYKPEIINELINEICDCLKS